jgi:Raf kinase inhibitor-like YbhB/YbcL family protein
MKTKFYIFLLVMALVGAGCSKNNPGANLELKKNRTMNIESSAFQPNGLIPEKYSCEGHNINPPLDFKDVPQNTKGLVLLMDDPDVPKNLKPDGVFDHWVIYNIPPETSAIVENTLNSPGVFGKNGRGEPKYTGPCPPDREHRYFFKLYALDTILNFPEPPDKAAVEKAMEGHIISQAELIGRYPKKK